MSDAESMDIIEEENDSQVEDEESESKADNDSDKEVYLPGKPLAEGEELICDQSAYVMLHQAQTGAPCLSFDIIKDNLGNNRETYPLTAYIVSGTQTGQAHNNIIVMKLTNLHATQQEDDDDDDDDESDNENNKNPKMVGALIKHQGCVNRIRVCVHFLRNNVLSLFYKY